MQKQHPEGEKNCRGEASDFRRGMAPGGGGFGKKRRKHREADEIRSPAAKNREKGDTTEDDNTKARHETAADGPCRGHGALGPSDRR